MSDPSKKDQPSKDPPQGSKDVTHSPQKPTSQSKQPHSKQVGGASGKGQPFQSTGTSSGISAKLSKEEKKKQKAERRSQKKVETGKTGQSGATPGGDSGQRKEGGREKGGVSEQVKSQAKVIRQIREKSLSQSEDEKKVQLFSHLHQYERTQSLTKSLGVTSDLPPVIVRLAIMYSSGVICGSNSRCLAMLGAFKKVIQDYSTPPQKELSRDLQVTIKPYINFLTTSRPLSVSMGNAIKWLKLTITNVPLGTPENEAKEKLCKDIDEYIHEKITLADEAISAAVRKGIIKNGDVILIYAHSSIVTKCLIDAHEEGIQFKVIIVDSRPKMEGHHSLKKLVNAGIPCSYIFINAVSYIMKEVSKVIVGAHAVLANGYVMSRVGTSLIALVANSYNVPVLVCCETYKFSEKVQTDAFVTNELGDPNDLVPINRRHGNILSGWKEITSLGVLNLTYDVTSSDLVAMVITEVGNIPCTSVPVVLRLTQMNN